MIVSNSNVTVVCLSRDEISKIADSLEIAFHECRDFEAMALYSQFNDLREVLESEGN
ncbi:hypothetical protein [Sporosarcina sp. FSL K6-1508]|uniref:hypothetical protein n=1 Tax=Sporosarcina sp. FSL K6-1508 TaxID=2921553 RepID=UPI0030FB5E23